MKSLFFSGLVLFTSYSYAGLADDACLKSAKTWVLKSESKKTGAKIDLIKDSENKLIGSGANLFLMSIFVSGPNIGHHTHWEVVGEFDYNKHTCNILLGRRYYAH